MGPEADCLLLVAVDGLAANLQRGRRILLPQLQLSNGPGSPLHSCDRKFAGFGLP